MEVELRIRGIGVIELDLAVDARIPGGVVDLGFAVIRVRVGDELHIGMPCVHLPRPGRHWGWSWGRTWRENRRHRGKNHEPDHTCLLAKSFVRFTLACSVARVLTLSRLPRRALSNCDGASDVIGRLRMR